MVKDDQIFVLPVEGRRVKDPGTLILLGAEGEWKPVSSYWMRRLQCGDIVEGSPEAGILPPHSAPEADPSTISKQKKTKKSESEESNL